MFSMAETTTETAVAGEQNEQGAEAVKEFEAITSQEALDKIIQARVARERAKIPTDYEELQAKAAKLAEIEEANKTEAQKTADRLQAAEQRAAELELQVVRAAVAEAKSDPAKGIVIPASLLTGSTKEELEASADALIEFRGEQKLAPSSSAIGRTNSAAVGSSPADAFAQWSEDHFQNL